MANPWRRIALVAVLALSVAGVACGRDDDGDARETPASATREGRTTATATATAMGDIAAYCDAIVATEAMAATGPASPDELEPYLQRLDASFQTAAEAAPDDDVRAAVENAQSVLVNGLRNSGPAVFDSPEWQEAEGALDAATRENCDLADLKLTALDYEYEGMPEEVEDGLVALELHNAGTELHEAIVFRVNDEETPVTELVAKLAKLTSEEAAAELQFAGAAFAAAGQTDTAFFKLPGPGRYLVSCFISQGTIDLSAEGTGPPHFELGMVDEFTTE